VRIRERENLDSVTGLKKHLNLSVVHSNLVGSITPLRYASKIIAIYRVAVISAKNHKRQRRKRQSVTAKREKSQTPKVLTAILILPNLT